MIRRVSADIAVIGASLGGVMAAYQACQAGRTVVLTSEFAWLGGQMTAQGVPPDEHRLIESGGASKTYMQFRQAIRSHYQANPQFQDRTELTEGCNPGDGWVSRLCFEPKVAADYFETMLAPFVANGKLTILRDTKLSTASMDSTNRRRIIGLMVERGGVDLCIDAKYYLDATDTGELIAKVSIPYRLGKEAQSEFGETDAPLLANRMDQQPITMVMALRLRSKISKQKVECIDKPAEYNDWKHYVVPHYNYPLFSNAMPGSQRAEVASLPFFAQGQTLDWWRYRRVVSARNWLDSRDEVSLVNWSQNDYALHPLLDGAVTESDVVASAKQLSLSFLYWLQNEAPQHDHSRVGYQELELAHDELGTGDGMAQQVYVRESRRIIGVETLAQEDIRRVDSAVEAVACNVENSVGVAWYNMDIHPTCVSGHGVNAKVRPFTLPLGIFISQDCDNLIPSCKNVSVTHLVNAATRVHPIEWIIGEVAATLADFALSRDQRLADIHVNAHLVRDFQKKLVAIGIPIEWENSLIAKLNQSTEKHRH